MKVSNIVIGIIASVGLILGGFAITHQMQVAKDGQSIIGPQGPVGDQGPAGRDGKDGARGPQGIQGPAGSSVTLGSVPGDSLNGPCFTIGGVKTCYGNQAISQATSTLCSIISPSGTSTLMLSNLQIKTATSSAVVAFLSTSTTKYLPNVQAAATTTVLASAIVAASAAPLLSYFPTATLNGGSATLGVNATSTALSIQLAPNTYVIWGAHGGGIVEGNVPSGSVFAGSCTAEFVQTN